MDFEKRKAQPHLVFSSLIFIFFSTLFGIFFLCKAYAAATLPISIINFRSWPGTKLDCEDRSCTIPVVFLNENNGEQYVRLQIPHRFKGPNTFHELNDSICHRKNCIIVGEASNDGTNFIPLAYYSNNQGRTWQLSLTQPPPIKEDIHRDKMTSVECDNTGIICNAEGNFNGLLKAKWLSQDGGKNWLKVKP